MPAIDEKSLSIVYSAHDEPYRAALVRPALSPETRVGVCAAGLQIPDGATLSITSASGNGSTDGKLTATGGSSGAGIGSNNQAACGNITIRGGVVEAIAGVEDYAYTPMGIGGGGNGTGTTAGLSGNAVVFASSIASAWL